MSQARFQKREREKARQERAAEKTARRRDRREERETTATAPARDEAGVLAELAALHGRFEAGAIELDDFLTAREDLTQRLTIP